MRRTEASTLAFLDVMACGLGAVILILVVPGPLLVCEALAMTLAHKNPERAITGLKELEGLRKNLLNGEGSL